MVLGQPGPKHSTNRAMVNVDNTTMLSDEGPLNLWTSEEPVPWSAWYERNNIEVEVME